MMAQARRTRADMLAITRAKLISAGRATFGEIGYADASMDEITAAVGLTRGALYHQFDGKKGLLEAVVEQIEDEFHEALVKIRQTVENPWKAFLAGCHVFLDLATQPEYQRIMLRDAPSVLGPPDPATHRCTRSLHAQGRSEERRVGKEGVSTCRSRGSTITKKKKTRA